MHAETVLKLTMQDTLQQAAQNRDAWIRAYREIVSEHPAAEDLAEQLIDRVQRAYAVLEERETLRSDGSLCQDPAYMEEFIRQEEQQEAALDGAFPLGREEDAAFALPYFPIPDLARIQLGFAAQVHTGTYSEYAQDVLVRKGILLEVLGQWKEAERCYQGVSTSSVVQQREFACRTKAQEQGEALYQKGMACVEQLDWDGAWYPFSQAADLGHREALAELGFMTVYGTGCGRCIEEGLDYLRTAAKQGSAYACQVLWELHDEGLRDVTGAEAQAWCRAAAEQGNAKALARLEDGFDLRPVTEILRERIGQGDVDALWYLAQELGDTQEAAGYMQQAADAGQVDALLFYAELYGDPAQPELYDPVKADACYRQAAEQGCEKAILTLGDRALHREDPPFWNRTEDPAAAPEDLHQRHRMQFDWYLKAAQGGCVSAMSHVATAYHYGYPVEQDDRQAFLWASRSADAGDSYGMYACGYFYEHALGCEQDLSAALLLYTRAAEAGELGAMYRLIDIYETGRKGIPADPAKASRYRFAAGMNRD